MKKTLQLALLALAAAALPARAEIGDITRYNMRPLIQLHLNGADFIGRPFQGDVFIYQGGPTFLSYKGANGTDVRSESAVASPEALRTLDQALARAHVGQQQGNCGTPAADFVSEYGLTWYGAQRVRTIPAGGNFSTCPAEVVEIYNATCEFIWAVLGPQVEVCVVP